MVKESERGQYLRREDPEGGFGRWHTGPCLEGEKPGQSESLRKKTFWRRNEWEQEKTDDREG